MGRPTLLETNEIAILDFGKLVNAEHPLKTCKEILKICDELKEAFSHRRVVYIINHGITEQETKKMYSLMDKFLALPEEEKLKFKLIGGSDCHGYIPQNKEQFYDKNKFEIRESFNAVGKDRHYPTEHIPEFPQCVEEIKDKFMKVAKLLLELFAVGMNVEPDFLLNAHKNMWNHLHNTTILRVMHYPAVDIEPHAGIIRCGEHTDFGTFTLLMQDSEGGLEVCGEDGEWRRVGYIPGAIFVNCADLLEIWTGGIYKATKHRVVVPEETSKRTRSRYSLSFCVQPDHSVMVKPAQTVPGTEVEEVNSGEYINNLFYGSGIVKQIATS